MKFKSPKPFVASLIIACMLTCYNIPMFIATSSTTWVSDVGTLFVLAAVTSLIIYLLSINVLLVRLLTVPLVIVNSAFLYFILFYKIKIYPPLMSAIFETETTEAIELLSVKLVFWIAIVGLIPAYLIIRLTRNINVSKQRRVIFHCVLVTLTVLLHFNIWNTYSSVRPVAKNFKHSYPFLQPSYAFNRYLPYSYIYNTKLHIARSLNYISQKKNDIIRKYSFKLASKENKNTFVVLVVGESARADRFSLNGYEKNTNPRLSLNKNIVSYTDCHSLDTSTVPAIPHIFIRDLRAKKMTEQKETSFLHVLKHLGFRTFWLSCWRTRPDTLIYDISLEANVTAYAPHIETYNSNATDKTLLYDHALLEPLKETLRKNKNGMIVLHTKGSHGGYYHRVPKDFHGYAPTCKDNCIGDLPSLNNTYDNTILYTDFFLNEVINILRDKDAILLYVSDHGESLGEDGMFSHSAPIETAPKEQTHIPMIWWASDKFLSKPANLDRFAQIKANVSKPVDQGHIFHSILDCIGIESEAVNKNKSVCRGQLLK